MINIILARFAYTPIGTFGRLREENGAPLCFTVEESWVNNINHISCIPEGEYVCRRGSFPRFGETFEVTNVPKRTAILFHRGNTVYDVEGCICPGTRLGALDGGTWAVLDSDTAYRKFMARFTGVDEFMLRVTQYRP